MSLTLRKRVSQGSEAASNYFGAPDKCKFEFNNVGHEKQPEAEPSWNVGDAMASGRKVHHVLKLGNEVVSHLPLQVVLYFNLCYFPAWLTVSLVTIVLKYSYLNHLYQFIMGTVMVAVSIIEVIRLYLGYLGNLTEKVPELAGFWLLTVLLQTPLQGFLLFNEDLIILPMERAANIIMFTIILVELITGFLALKRMTRHQAKKFHLHQFRIDR